MERRKKKQQLWCNGEALNFYVNGIGHWAPVYNDVHIRWASVLRNECGIPSNQTYQHCVAARLFWFTLTIREERCELLWLHKYTAPSAQTNQTDQRKISIWKIKWDEWNDGEKKICKAWGLNANAGLFLFDAILSIIKFPDHGHENTPQNKLDFFLVSTHIVTVSHVCYSRYDSSCAQRRTLLYLQQIPNFICSMMSGVSQASYKYWLNLHHMCR